MVYVIGSIMSYTFSEKYILKFYNTIYTYQLINSVFRRVSLVLYRLTILEHVHGSRMFDYLDYNVDQTVW